MTQPIIEIKNLGKQYSRKTVQTYISLRDSISHAARSLFRNDRSRQEKFWALQDINLDIRAGERVGIIGSNGAGKSTLLKILSRITSPTTGSVTLHGRVGSLLEIGTGFHPELTGRENIFLNGSILGLKRSEITRQLEEIIDFSGVEKFIDSPMKHFSSGMQLRLAFAVAAHLEPEILLIDEVLSVGDAEFQQKCMGKMEEVSRNDGRTILFVSHQLNAIQKLCSRGAWFDKGKLMFDGPVNGALEKYTGSVQIDQTESYYQREPAEENKVFVSMSLRQPKIHVGENLQIGIRLNEKISNRHLVLNINVYNAIGEFISHILNEDDKNFQQATAGDNIEVQLCSLNLVPGKYYLSFWAGLDMIHTLDSIEKALSFEITEQNNFTSRVAPFPTASKAIIKSVWRAG